MPLENIKRALLCKHCQECYILRADYFCNIDGCDCTEEKEFETILDLYAFLYRSLDNMNYTDYQTLVQKEPDKVERACFQLEDRWNHHADHLSEMYREKIFIALQENTRRLFLEELEHKESLEDVLLFMIQFLLLLDKHLVELKNDYIAYGEEHEFPIQTRYGLLIYKQDDVVIQEAIREHPASGHIPDPNYLLLRRCVRNLFAVQSRYPYYQVRHQYLSTPKLSGEDRLRLTLGLLPGNFDIDKDYILKVDDQPTNEGLLPFYFQGARDPVVYCEHVMEPFKMMLVEKPHIIVLPELFTPPDLREALVEEMMDHPAPHLAFMLAGTFHEEVDGQIYNLGHVVNGRGEELLEVNKMNLFKIPSNPTYKGELAYFNTYGGIEKNAYDHREITLYETLLGRIAFTICVDFINDNYQEVLRDRQVDLVFVMAMTPNPAGGKFLRKMQDLAERNNCIVVLCNNLGLPDNPEPPAARAVVSLPGFKQVYQTDQSILVITLNDIIHQLASKHWKKL